MSDEQTSIPEGRQGSDGPAQRSPYEAPRLVRFGRVSELTAGGKPGVSDITSAGSII
jgi:hypothetical protein